MSRQRVDNLHGKAHGYFSPQRPGGRVVVQAKDIVIVPLPVLSEYEASRLGYLTVKQLEEQGYTRASIHVWTQLGRFEPVAKLKPILPGTKAKINLFDPKAMAEAIEKWPSKMFAHLKKEPS